ncbi:MAG: hypothetical protein UU73_C0002G0094 [Candidatus Daviesbacteria bacterium GW2011_GWA1_41_61]|nr:MAG: hypothetical protein UU26_C0010G0016 [Candidatus Daviesbacteria bacterium GW2011_GWC1_40_9]KKR93754.1 MAG: hypothetical protein UU44_C0001G0094 [Candidatus Daviesbacteria bacterium GW2011_GWB1_41_15]KKS15220.1 MAG: hypothetical protein UU73_C0002G0094 [Candidatus Daviesbacteria bacterium GW2011_GWA1_41_61]
MVKKGFLLLFSLLSIFVVLAIIAQSAEAATNQCNGSGILVGPVYLNTINVSDPDYYSLGGFKIAVRVEQITPTAGVEPGYFFANSTDSCGTGCIRAPAFCVSIINSQGKSLADSTNRVRVVLPSETLIDGTYFKGLLRTNTTDPGGTITLRESSEYIKTVEADLNKPSTELGEIHYSWNPPSNLISNPTLTANPTVVLVNEPKDVYLTMNLGSRLTNRYDFVIQNPSASFKGVGQIVCQAPQNRLNPQCVIRTDRSPPEWFKNISINTTTDALTGQSSTVAILVIQNANTLPEETYRPELTPVGLPQVSTSFEVTSKVSTLNDVKPVLVPSTLDTKATSNAKIEIHLENGTSDFYYAYPKPEFKWQIQLSPPEYSAFRYITLPNTVDTKNSATFQLTPQGLLPNPSDSQGYKIEVKDTSGNLRGVAYLKVTGTRDSPPPRNTGGDPVKCKTGDPKCTSAAGIPCTNGILTAIGCVPTDPAELVKGLMKLFAGAGGAIALLLMAFGAIQMITSQGSPEGIKAGQERFTSAALGLLFIIFSVLLLEIIGVNILGLDQFGIGFNR